MKKAFYIVGSLVVVVAVLYYVAIPAILRGSYRRVRATNCVINMRAILKEAAVTWPHEQLPLDFVSMSNLFTPKLLVCPADLARHSATNWSTFTPNNCSYVILAPGMSKTDTNKAFLRCNIHGFEGYADGRILDSSGRLMKQRSITGN